MAAVIAWTTALEGAVTRGTAGLGAKFACKRPSGSLATAGPDKKNRGIRIATRRSIVMQIPV